MASVSDPLVQELLHGRYIGTLATENADGSVHMVAVWYLFEDGAFYVGTSSKSRKARNVAERSRASLMIDSRPPGTEHGLTAMGRAELVGGDRSRELNQRIQQRYMDESGMKDPRIGGALAAVDDVTLKLTPERWLSWDLRVLDREVFGGELAKHLLPLDG